MDAPGLLDGRQLTCSPFSRLITFNAFDGRKQDFVGQDLVERRARVILWASAVRTSCVTLLRWSRPTCSSSCQAVAFVLGFALQNLKITFAIFTLGFLGCLAVCLPVLALLDIAHASNEQVTLPPLPAYNAHPVKWLDPLGEYGEVKSAVAAGGSSGAIEGKKGR